MESSTNKLYFNFFLYLFFYLVILIIEGSVRLYFLQTRNFDNFKFATLASNLNMILTSLFAVIIIIGIYFIIYNFKLLYNSKITTETILTAINQTVLVYIFFQFIKIILDIYYLSNYKEKDLNPNELYNILIDSDWFFMASSVNTLMYIIGLVVFSLEVYEREKKHIKDVFILSFSMSLCIFAMIYSL